MSKPSNSDQQEPDHADSFEERIAILFEELSFAVQWQRPSILLVIYESGYLRGLVELALEERLAGIGQQAVQFRVDAKNFDIPEWLSQRPDRDRSVFFVDGLSRGGGEKSANAYRALNIRRELLVDHAIRTLIWLAKEEATALTRHAPDFWAFRHRVVEFHEASLALPYHAQRTSVQAIRRLQKEILSAKESNDFAWLAKLRGNLGAICLDSNQLVKAVRAYWKATRLTLLEPGLWVGLGQTYLMQENQAAARRILKRAAQAFPQDTNIWLYLGHVYRREGNLSDAIMAYQQAIQIDPHNSLAHLALLAWSRISGRDHMAGEQSNLQRSILEQENEYTRAIFESICGHPRQALDLLANVLEKNLLGANWVRHDPNLDLIRQDPNFKKLPGLVELNSREV